MTAPIITQVGHTGADELRFRGRRVFSELLGHTSAAQMLVLGVSGRLLDSEQIAVIDDIVTAMSSADPRLWPFKVTRLASAHGSASYGVAATLVAGEGGMYGTARLRGAARWLVDLARRAGDTGPADHEIATALDDSGHGFGVLYRAHDERYEALMRQVERRDRHQLPFARICRQAARVAREQKQLEPHVSVLIAALCLDLTLSPDAIAMLGIAVLFHDALANATEGAQQQPAVLQRLPPESIDYRGSPPRRSPRARASSEVG